MKLSIHINGIYSTSILNNYKMFIMLTLISVIPGGYPDFTCKNANHYGSYNVMLLFYINTLW